MFLEFTNTKINNNHKLLQLSSTLSLIIPYDDFKISLLLTKSLEYSNCGKAPLISGVNFSNNILIPHIT